jgi:alpha-ketoglutarate-dependent taurine dioxygenase
MTTATNLGIMPLGPRLGCQVRICKHELLSGERAAELRGLLVEHGVLCFPQAHLSDGEQADFAATLGPVMSDRDVSADKSVNANAVLADYQKSSMFWHFDGFGVPVPEFATMMSPRFLEDGKGGATEFANCHAAYEDLREADKLAIESLQAVHSFETLMRMAKPWPSYAELKAWQGGGHVHTHPVVWHHDSGRKSLLLGGSASHIEGMPGAEARLLICRLNQWITQPQYVYRYEWKLGDLVIWDNTGTLHRAVPYSSTSKRLMHRTTIGGQETPV